MDHCLYKHTFPDGKVYIGQTLSGNTEKRWNNGHGYKGQAKIFAAIIKYGWDNISHEVILDGIPDEAIDAYETLFIHEYNSDIDGYNTASGTYRGVFDRTRIHTGRMIAASIEGQFPRFDDLMNKPPDKDNDWQLEKQKSGHWNQLIVTLVMEALLAADKSYRDLCGHSLVFDLLQRYGKDDQIDDEILGTIEKFIDIAEWSVKLWLETDERHAPRVFGWTEGYAYQKLMEGMK